jgi:hypothetical protein
MFTRALHLSLSWARSIYSTSPHAVSFKIHLNIILPPTFFFLVVPFLLAFPPKSYMHSSSPYACYVPSPSHPPCLDYSNCSWWRVCYEVPHYAVFSNFISVHLPSVQISSSALFSNTLGSCFFLNVRDEVSHPYKTTGKIIVLHILIFTFFGSRQKTKYSGLNGNQHYLDSSSSSFPPESNFDVLLPFSNIWTVPHF